MAEAGPPAASALVLPAKACSKNGGPHGIPFMRKGVTCGMQGVVLRKHWQGVAAQRTLPVVVSHNATVPSSMPPRVKRRRSLGEKASAATSTCIRPEDAVGDTRSGAGRGSANHVEDTPLT
jgi:hypothetical protein